MRRKWGPAENFLKTIFVKTRGLSGLWQPSSWKNKPLQRALTFCSRSTFLVSWHCTPLAPSVHTGLGTEPDGEREGLQGRILKIHRSGVPSSNIWFQIKTRRETDYFSPSENTGAGRASCSLVKRVYHSLISDLGHFLHFLPSFSPVHFPSQTVTIQ